MKILIAGGGIGGMSAAIGLGRLGHEVVVLERTLQPKPVGAGISLQPNAMQALATLGLDSAIAEQGCQSTEAFLRHANGKQIQRFDFSGHLKRYGFLPYTIQRSTLFDILSAAARESSVDIRFGYEVDSFKESNDEVVVQTVSNESFRGDTLIGADGINSRVREQLLGKQEKRYSGYVCWRGIVAASDLTDRVDTMNEIWGKGARFGFMPCSPTNIYWFATKTTPDRTQEVDWKSTFRDWPSPVEELIDTTPNDRIAFNDICDRKPISTWSRGRIALLGDAAHPMTPNFGQGGAQAIEDAVVLSRAFEKCDSVDSALKSYERHRNERANELVIASRQFGSLAQGGGVFQRLIRDNLLPMIPDRVIQKKLHQQFDFRSHLDSFECYST